MWLILELSRNRKQKMSDTGFSKTLPAEEPSKIETEKMSSISHVSTKPTRTRKPTEKEFEFNYSQKEKSRRAATKTFCDQLNVFFTFLAITQEPHQITGFFWSLLMSYRTNNKGVPKPEILRCKIANKM